MNNLYKALSEFQQEVPVILKDTEGYGYQYADLPKIFEVIMPLLEKHGLGFYQSLTTTEEASPAGTTPIPAIKTVVFHIESGEQIDGTITIPDVEMKGMNKFQSLGSGITYLRRYALSSMLGLITDKDTDASGEEKKVEKKKTVDDFDL